jgi:hypothetical protein
MYCISNISFYRNGRYCKETCPVPTLYLRKYPEWAKSSEDLRKAAAVLDDAIVCQVLAHIIHYLSAKEKRTMCEYIPGSTVKNILSSVSDMCKETARDILIRNWQDTRVLYPIGKLQEAIAIYKWGVEFDGIGVRRQKLDNATVQDKNSKPSATTEQQSAIEEASVTTVEANQEQSKCMPYSITTWHNYSIPQSKSFTAEQHDNSKDCSTTARNCDKKLCSRIRCKKEKDVLREKIARLNQRVERLEEELEKITNQKNKAEEELKVLKSNDSGPSRSRCRLTIEEVRESDDLVLLHTGLPSVHVFDWLYKEIKDTCMFLSYWNGQSKETSNKKATDKKRRGRERALKKEEELLIALMKLKLNLNEQYVAFLFGVSDSTVSRVISTWIPFLAKELQGLIHWPNAEELSLCYPDCFKRWENVVAIIDCFEIPTEKPSHVEANSQIFSSYKNRPTVKFLLACTPGGSVSFISPAAGGNMSDVQIFRACNLADKFKAGEACMADKGFLIKGDLAERGVRLIIPPFVRKGKQFTNAKNKQNKAIAHSRIHVERVIGRVRDYMVLNSVIPLNQLDLIGPMAIVCCALTNLKESVVREHH